MNIAVVGAGAIGGWVAARLALAGHQVMALTSRGALDRLEISENGHSRTAQFGKFEGPAEMLVLAVKAPALADAARAAQPLMDPTTVIVPMLNGVPWWFTGEPLTSVDPGGQIASALPSEQLVGCVVHASCFRPSAGHVVVRHVDHLILGDTASKVSERATRLCSLFGSAGIPCEESGNIRRAIWYKLWGNATINPLSALTHSTADKLLADSILRAFMAEAMDELAAVGAAIGCPIEETAEDRMAVTARLGAFKSSMLQDVEAGRAIELEALVGAPLEIAGSVGVCAPQLERIYAATRLMAQNLGLL